MKDADDLLFQKRVMKPTKEVMEGAGLTMSTLRALRRGDRSVSKQTMLDYAWQYQRYGLNGSVRIQSWIASRRQWLKRRMEELDILKEALPFLEAQLQERAACETSTRPSASASHPSHQSDDLSDFSELSA